MTEEEYKRTLYEISEILKNLERKLTEKIPEKVRQEIERNKAKNHEFKYDSSKSLYNQNMLETTKKYLTMLYLRFWSTPEEKKQTLKAMHQNG